MLAGGLVGGDDYVEGPVAPGVALQRRLGHAPPFVVLAASEQQLARSRRHGDEPLTAILDSGQCPVVARQLVGMAPPQPHRVQHGIEGGWRSPFPVGGGRPVPQAIELPEVDLEPITLVQDEPGAMYPHQERCVAFGALGLEGPQQVTQRHP